MPKIPFWTFIILAIIHFTAVRVDVMDVDAAQYAEMSREMAESSNWLHLYDRGNEYLDKPPFLFWASALSMKIFGVSNFSYKFPSILFALWALFATYRLARLLYDERTARMAAFILGCSQGMFLMTNDVRTDTILMSWTITAIWLIREWEVSRKLYFLLLGAAAVSFGMMTKGPIALLVPVFCFASDWALKRSWKQFFRWEYLLAVLVMALLLIPMSVGLYQQFDMHPEKMVNGKTGVSGLRFFFWTQSFGRITGENAWDNGAPFSFLFENMLWSFLPWVLLFTAAFVIRIRELLQQRFRLTHRQESLTTGGFLLAYLALGSSRYQLPHYIFVVFPLAAVMVAVLFRDFFEGRFPLLRKALQPLQYMISVVLLIAALLTFAYVFEASRWLYVLWVVLMLLWVVLMIRKPLKGKMFWSGALAIMIANIFLTNHFYYQLLHFQTGSPLGRRIHQMNIPAEQIKVGAIDDPLVAVSFYAHRPIARRTDTIPALEQGDFLITGNEAALPEPRQGLNISLIEEGYWYKVTELTPEFLNPETREQTLKKYYFFKVGRQTEPGTPE